MSELATKDLSQAAQVHLALGRIMRSLRRIDGGNGSLTAGSSSALSTITHAGPMRLRDLAEAEGVTPPTMSRIVGVLEGAGHVARTSDPTDARAALLHATAEGRELINGVKSARVQHLAQALEQLPDDQRAILASALVAVEHELRHRIA